MNIFGYTNQMSYAPGERVVVHGHVDRPTDVAIDLVRLRLDGGLNLRVDAVAWDGAGVAEGVPQEHCVGSFLVAESPDGDGSFGAWVRFTNLAEAATSGIVARRSGSAVRGIALRGDRVVLWSVGGAGERTVIAESEAVETGAWYFIAVVPNEVSSKLAVLEVPSGRRLTVRSVEGVTLTSLESSQHGVTIGASSCRGVVSSGVGWRGVPIEPFDGKIEAPFALSRPLTDAEIEAAGVGNSSEKLAASDPAGCVWDFTPAPGFRLAFPDRNGHAEACAVNLPTSGVTGVKWNGRAVDFTAAPSDYAALHLHRDQVVDVGWASLIEADLPEDLRSGVYGIRLSAGDESDIVPIFVVPGQNSLRSAITVLVPTFTYLAYANEFMFEDELGLGDIAELDPRDTVRQGRPEFGRSLYDLHADGTGVMFSSAGRAILDMRPDYRFWLTDSGRGFSGDMYLLEWLAREGYEFDVITDLELHSRGADALGETSVVITGAHPEYMSNEMLDAFEAFRRRGGNLMYLGGNGFYQVTGVLTESPLVVEIRRGMAGVRTWESAPGEVTLVSTGEPGGLWRHRGRAPQTIAAVGFCTQGFDASSPYERTDESYGEDASWVFAGVEGGTFGTAGAVMGGAAGDELDRVDFSLGSPSETVVLASSVGHSVQYQRVIEELRMLTPGGNGGGQDPEVRSDVVLVPASDGLGAIFSVGSIAWSGSLVTEVQDPSISKITANVVNAFAGLSG